TARARGAAVPRALRTARRALVAARARLLTLHVRVVRSAAARRVPHRAAARAAPGPAAGPRAGLCGRDRGGEDARGRSQPDGSLHDVLLSHVGAMRRRPSTMRGGATPPSPGTTMRGPGRGDEFQRRAAIASISTRAPAGNAATWTVARAGCGAG